MEKEMQIHTICHGLQYDSLILREMILTLVSCSVVFVRQDFSPRESRTLFTKVNESDKRGYSYEETETLGNNNNVKVRITPTFPFSFFKDFFIYFILTSDTFVEIYVTIATSVCNDFLKFKEIYNVCFYRV